MNQTTESGTVFKVVTKAPNGEIKTRVEGSKAEVMTYLNDLENISNTLIYFIQDNHGFFYEAVGFTSGSDVEDLVVVNDVAPLKRGDKVAVFNRTFSGANVEEGIATLVNPIQSFGTGVEIWEVKFPGEGLVKRTVDINNRVE